MAKEEAKSDHRCTITIEVFEMSVPTAHFKPDEDKEMRPKDLSMARKAMSKAWKVYKSKIWAEVLKKERAARPTLEDLKNEKDENDMKVERNHTSDRAAGVNGMSGVNVEKVKMTA